MIKSTPLYAGIQEGMISTGKECNKYGPELMSQGLMETSDRGSLEHSEIGLSPSKAWSLAK